MTILIPKILVFYFKRLIIRSPESLFLLAFVGLPVACIVRLQFYILNFLNCKPFITIFGLKHLFDNKKLKCKMCDFTIPRLMGWAIYIKRHAWLWCQWTFYFNWKVHGPLVRGSSPRPGQYEHILNIY